MISLPRNVLLSYFYYSKVDFSILKNLNLIADSGAFSADRLGARIKLADYVAWLRDWDGWFMWAASLDVINDKKATRRNWLVLRDKYGVDTVPTIHFGDEPSAMDFYAAQGVRFMGLGGLVGVKERPRGAWLAQVFKYQRERWPGVEFHGWGVTQWPLLRFPFRSVDSSSWNSGTKFGDLILRDPRSLRDYRLDLSRGGSAPSLAAQRLLRAEYGTSWEQIKNSRPENRTEILLVSARTAKVLEDRFNALHAREREREREKLAEPASCGHMDQELCSARRLHLADTGMPNLKALTLPRQPVERQGDGV